MEGGQSVWLLQSQARKKHQQALHKQAQRSTTVSDAISNLAKADDAQAISTSITKANSTGHSTATVGVSNKSSQDELVVSTLADMENILPKELPQIALWQAFFESARGRSGHSLVLWQSFIVATVLTGGAIFVGLRISGAGGQPKADSPEVGASGRWQLIIASAIVQVVSGSVYAMGAWQDALRDSLGVSISAISTIGAATFWGTLAAMLGGQLYDRFGPRTTLILGGTMCTLGYLLIGTAVVAGDAMPTSAKLSLAALGSLFAGYSSVSLLDNIVCMACSVSFPSDKAAVVGYLKAVLATAAGLWALLWVHVFQGPNGPGLPAYIALTAIVSFGATMLSVYGVVNLPEGPSKQKFRASDFRRLGALIIFMVLLSVFDVGVSFFYSSGKLVATASLGYIGVGLALLPLVLLVTTPTRDPEQLGAAAGMLEGQTPAAAPPAAAANTGVDFLVAAGGLDFWLVWFMQFAVFGSGVATNQNLALIMESAGNKESAGLGVALFALTSSLSRVVVGILSDQYPHVLSRFQWLVMVAASAAIGEFFVSTMHFGGIMVGVLFMGMAFGSFFTVIVPVVGEMYGKKRYGVILGSQLASQAAASFIICFKLLPTLYNHAAHGESVCIGPACYRTSFLVLTVLNLVGLVASVILSRRNSDTLPIKRLGSS